MIVGIIGVGLLGGSLGHLLKKSGWADKVIGFGRNEDRLKNAIELRAIDEYSLEIDENMNRIDMLILAVPVKLMAGFVKKAMPFMKKGAIITDVGSTKYDITVEIEKLIGDSIYFIGGHPMAGSEKTGVEYLDTTMFENAMYVVCKTKKSDENAFEKVCDMARELKANVLEMNLESHDFAVATISHLPHIVAASLVNCAAGVNNKENHILSLAAGGFRDTTRIASGSPEMWRDICLTNSKEILNLISKFKSELGNFEKVIEAKDGEALFNLFSSGKLIRDELPQKRKAIIPSTYDILLYVEDVPGTIAKISRILGDNNFNIKDIDVQHIRERDGGQIRVGLEMDNECEKAPALLEKYGFKIKVL